MTTQNENNGGLYFIVGALFVAVLAIGVMFFSQNDETNTIEPAAGVERAADQVEETTNEFKIELDEDGVSGSSSQSRE